MPSPGRMAKPARLKSSTDNPLAKVLCELAMNGCQRPSEPLGLTVTSALRLGQQTPW
jgi:hypothetical protein